MNAHMHEMRWSRPQIVAAFTLAFSAIALVLSRVKPDQSTSSPKLMTTIIARHPTMSAPQVEKARLRADEYLTDPLLVEVTGRDFVWHFRYSGPDGALNTCDDVSTGEALHLPCEYDVRFVVKSEDYLYNLSVSELNLRQIAVPELTFEKAFRTQGPGVFEMPADPMCGVRLFHDRLMGRVIVQRQTLFIDWLSEFAPATLETYSENSPSSR